MKVDWPYEFPGLYWLDSGEEAAVLDVLRSGTLFRYYGLSQPKYVDTFEVKARKFYGSRYALAVNSGTGALMCALTALGIGPGCEVIVPSFMWVASVGTIVGRGAIPVLCEVDDSFCMDPEDLERKITPRTKLIMPIHMAGNVTDMDAVMDIANRHGIPVLEDAAQCNGGSFRGKKLGTIGAMGIFSLQINKNMTCGDGGLIVTNDDKLYNRAFGAHDTGMIRVNGRPAMPDADVMTWGGGRRLNELSGAVASIQIDKLPGIVEHMRASNRRISAMLKGTPGLSFRRLNDPEGETGVFLVLILGSESKARGAEAKMRTSGLHNVFRISDYGLHIYYNIPMLVDKIPLSPAGDPWNLPKNAGSVYDYSKGACPQSDDLFSRSIIVPIPSRLTEEQETAAAGAIREAVL